MTEHHRTLERYDYVGSDPKMIMVADNYLRTTEPKIEAREVQSHEYAEQFAALGNSILELGRDMRLDLSDRLRGSDYIHLYKAREYKNVRRQFSLNMGSVAVHSTSGHMFASKGRTPLATLANVNHELVHVMSRKLIRPEVTYDNASEPSLSLSRSHDGYSSFRHGTFNAVNEVLTEITNIDLIRNYWPHYPELHDIAQEHYENIGYLPQLVLFDELLEDGFDKPYDIFKQLQRGLFTGEMGILRIITEVIGADTMRKLAALDTNDPICTLLLAQELGLDEVVRKIQTNETDELLSWL
jgi:hypothetical protein